MPLISAAKLKGIISWLGAVPVFWAMRSTIGMKIATTPVELMTAPSPATTDISRTISRASLLPALATSQSPSRCATPVRTSPSPSTNSSAIRITLGSAKPASASGVVMTPVSGSRTSISSATASMRGLLRANMTTAAASRARTSANSVFMSPRPPAGPSI